ncbi:MarR family transcriptional regulator [Flavobacterium supellecticarium]|uniref:MarR family transcriptional regulator n=1 Tax=Flavobacterium supellecticarium TaxID=2565924 RepID=A0A4S3ZU05_9FLAO|nr:helix-turn-helix domain-containing protein [Flavobacterium supellecticarium]THF49189.1 MarR family transcriptional regulator [Flavobacterium supellecticarium]
MNYQLIQEVLQLVEKFDLNNTNGGYTEDINGFKRWISDHEKKEDSYSIEPNWEGKAEGRSPESVISTLLVHLNRYAKTYSRSAIQDSEFSTQEDFIYLINLKAFGAMTKMELIKKNIQDKPTGMQIINRLIKNGWVTQSDSETDKRSKVIEISPEGLQSLDAQMGKIRLATQIVSGDLSHSEKMQLIRLLNKLDDFHHPIFSQQIDSHELLQKVNATYFTD